MKHNFMTDRDSIFNYLIITASMKVIEEVTEAKTEDGIYDITMQVNGVEVDAENFVNRWQDNVARMVTEEAEKLIREKFGDFDDTLLDLTELLGGFEISIGEVIKKKIQAMIAPEVQKK